jgi:hypothetical protein
VDLWATIALIAIGAVFGTGLTVGAIEAVKGRTKAIDRNVERRAQRRRRAKALRAADHALEKQVEKVLPRAQARIHVDGDRK